MDVQGFRFRIKPGKPAAARRWAQVPDRLMLDVASGRRKTWAEQWKLHNTLVLFNPAPAT